MSRFNKTATAEPVTNLAGGEAFAQSRALELVSILLTSFAGDTYYRSADDTAARLAALVGDDPEFSARAILYARNQFGMRSISHVGASHLAPFASGKAWAPAFYKALVRRPDDMLETVAYHRGRGEKLSGAMKKGFAAAFDKFDAYQLGKYRGDGKAYRLLDLANLLHPTPTERNAEALKALMNDELRAEGTWEMMLTQAGQNAETPEQKAALKAGVWLQLLTGKKLGYFALLRNLRNIIQQAPKAVPLALAQLVDPELIRKSLVLPFRFSTAYRELMNAQGPEARQAVLALGRAADISLANVPKLEGRTLVALDVSGSMNGRPAEIGALFAAVFAKAMNADLLTFDDRATFRQIDAGNSTLSIAEGLRFYGGGTSFHCIFEAMGSTPFDRVIILSDMQAWVESASYGHPGNPSASLAAYRRASGCDPAIWSFDLKGYGTLQFPERKVRALSGFSEKLLELMPVLESDPQALVKAVREHPLA